MGIDEIRRHAEDHVTIARDEMRAAEDAANTAWRQWIDNAHWATCEFALHGDYIDASRVRDERRIALYRATHHLADVTRDPLKAAS